MSVRTRFAPSPTGFLHVGSVRTALFAWLYAKKFGGEFVLRIEDTDRERSTQESVQAIFDGLDWLGIKADLGPFYQTERYPRYFEVAKQLFEQGKAYRCDCSKERLEQLREAQMQAKQKPRYDGCCRHKGLAYDTPNTVLRFQNPETGAVCFEDQVYGAIAVENAELDDLILIRSDGHPTYNFAVVIDDWDMEISHVIRGDDHINNTPRQINLLQALGAPIPVYAHLPMILGEDGKRLSKRHGAVSVLQFKEQGILPQALLNYLVRLGWSAGDQEIFSLAEMQAQFDLGHVSRGAASFNYEKLYWLNQHYLRTEDPKIIAAALAWHFEAMGIDYLQGPGLEQLIAVQAERAKTLCEMAEKSLYFYQEQINYDEAAWAKAVNPSIRPVLEELRGRFVALALWDKEAIQACIQDCCTAFNLGMGKIAQPLRVAVTGSSNSPSIDITLELLGKHRVLQRLDAMLQKLL